MHISNQMCSHVFSTVSSVMAGLGLILLAMLLQENHVFVTFMALISCLRHRLVWAATGFENFFTAAKVARSEQLKVNCSDQRKCHANTQLPYYFPIIPTTIRSQPDHNPITSRSQPSNDSLRNAARTEQQQNTTRNKTIPPK